MSTLRLVLLSLVLLPPVSPAQAPPATKPKGTPLPEGAVARVGSLRLRCQADHYTKHSHGYPLRRHLAFLSGGQQLALVDEGFQLHVWDVVTGEEVRWLARQDDYAAVNPNCAALSPDGSIVASPGGEGLLLWDTRTGKPVKLIRFPQPLGLERLAFSADGKFLAGSGKAVHVWDVRTGREVRLLKVPHRQRDRLHLDPILTVLAFSPNSSYLAAVFNRYEIHIWDLSNGKRVRVYQGHEDEVIALAWSPDGKHLASAGREGAIHLWDDTSLDEVWRVIKEGVGQVAFSPDGKRLATGSEKGILLWDVKTGKEVRHFPGRASHVVFAPDDKTLASAAPDGRVQLWDVGTGKVRLAAKPPTRVQAAVFSNRGRLLTLGHSEGTVLQVDATTGKVLRRFPGPRKLPGDVLFAPDCKTLAMDGQRDGEVRLWDVVRNKELRCLEESGRVYRKRFSPDGRLLAVNWSGVADSRAGISLWTVGTGQRYCRLEESASADTVTFSPDSRAVAASSPVVDGYLALWETATGKRRRLWPRHSPLNTHTFAGDGRRLAVWDLHTIQLFDISSGRVSRVLPYLGGSYMPASEEVLAVAFSPNSKLLASSTGYDHYVYLWDTATGKRLCRLPGHRDFVRALAFSADGKRLVSGGDDGLAFVWDVQALLSKKKPQGKP